jgi:hypothetical protein
LQLYRNKEDNNKKLKKKLNYKKKEYNISKDRAKDGRMFKSKYKNKNNQDNMVLIFKQKVEKELQILIGI